MWCGKEGRFVKLKQNVFLLYIADHLWHFISGIFFIAQFSALLYLKNNHKDKIGHV